MTYASKWYSSGNVPKWVSDWNYRLKNRQACRRRVRASYLDRRIRALERYGARCEVCGIDNKELLVLDHINNDGAKERARLSSTYRFYKNLIEGKKRHDLKCLCQNCHALRHAFFSKVKTWSLTKAKLRDIIVRVDRTYFKRATKGVIDV